MKLAPIVEPECTAIRHFLSSGEPAALQRTPESIRLNRIRILAAILNRIDSRCNFQWDTDSWSDTRYRLLLHFRKYWSLLQLLKKKYNAIHLHNALGCIVVCWSNCFTCRLLYQSALRKALFCFLIVSFLMCTEMYLEHSTLWIPLKKLTPQCTFELQLKTQSASERGTFLAGGGISCFHSQVPLA